MVTFDEYLAHSKTGSKFVYHIGLLMKDRQQYEPWSHRWGHNDIHYAALNIWSAYEKGLIHLVQQKQSTGSGHSVYVYLAIKRPPNSKPPYRRRSDGPDNRRQELFGSFSGPRSTRRTTNRLGGIRPNQDRAS